MMQMRVHVMWCSLHVADTAVSQSRMYPRKIFRVGALEGCCMRINFVYVIIGSLTCHKHIWAGLLLDLMSGCHISLLSLLCDILNH